MSNENYYFGPRKNIKPGTGDPLHTQEPVTVASFRTWRGWRECVARDRYLTSAILTSANLAASKGGAAFALNTDVPFYFRAQSRKICLSHAAELRKTRFERDGG